MIHIKTFQKHNIRPTPLRDQIYSVIANKASAISKKEIEEQLQDLDRITLYRTLKVFEKKGMIHQVLDGTNTLKYASCEDQCSEHNHKHDHVHFYCNTCNETFCLDRVNIPNIPSPEAYTVQDVNILFSGKCKACNSAT